MNEAPCPLGSGGGPGVIFAEALAKVFHPSDCCLRDDPENHFRSLWGPYCSLSTLWLGNGTQREFPGYDVIELMK